MNKRQAFVVVCSLFCALLFLSRNRMKMDLQFGKHLHFISKAKGVKLSNNGFQPIGNKLQDHKNIQKAKHPNPEVWQKAKSEVQVELDWENMVKHDPKLADWRTCASSNYSSLRVINQKEFYNMGDTVTVEIILRDWYGRRKPRGGDVVRVWIKDPVRGASAAGYVVDNQDGSYQGVVRMLWSGRMDLRVTIATPREMIHLLYSNYWTGKPVRSIYGLFSDGDTNESTFCCPDMKFINSSQGFCNMTSLNFNLPWFCEKPRRLDCSTWRSVVTLEPKMKYSQAEKTMIKRYGVKYVMTDASYISKSMGAYRGFKVKKGNGPITLNFSHSNRCQNQSFRKRLVIQTVKAGSHFEVVKHVSKPCSQVHLETTWRQVPPSGYFYKEMWHSTTCNMTFRGRTEDWRYCLKGKTLRFYGDSTTRQMFQFVKTLLSLSLITGAWTTGKWRQPSEAMSQSNNMSIFWAPHAFPFNAGDVVSIRTFMKATHAYIDEIPAGSNDIVVIHFYLHFIAYHPETVRRHFREAAKSVQALKKRAPKTKVILKGSHIYSVSGELAGRFSDFWGLVYNQIAREEFAALNSKVVFLDLWDISVASENDRRHPDQTLLTQMMNYMMSYVCPSETSE